MAITILYNIKKANWEYLYFNVIPAGALLRGHLIVIASSHRLRGNLIKYPEIADVQLLCNFLAMTKNYEAIYITKKLEILIFLAFYLVLK
ncbi:hypothetical protein RFEPED_0870 [Rickettsia felis str. Pedreira]|uniref:Uncharacterized protein n=1 Tax=Rickettsia felis str. Pedreira TaxID=1359196 RepID=A0A0F3MV78_RICFI|nr:hypothetical protein [Rickettsia felis]KHO03741.1 hypothetical protein JS61_02460 [Rickettsia felis]KJV58489.1 hypothetical protein RFEPED_0870 [Rickettsia felis str. Pedreira]MDE8611709.1 hypothetical protein [Rickettsia felis]